MLVSRGGQYFVGNNLSWADLAVFQFTSDAGMGGKPLKVEISESLSPKIHSSLFPGPAGLPRDWQPVREGGQVPGIKNWVNARPVTAT